MQLNIKRSSKLNSNFCLKYLKLLRNLRNSLKNSKNNRISLTSRNKYYIVNSKISFNRASGGPRSSEPICSCSVQKPLGACTDCESAREQFRAFQRLLRDKISINAFILWKMRPVFEKCSWLIIPNITHTYMTYTHSLRITLARKSPESIDSVIQLRVTWMTSLSQCSRRCGLAKNIRNLPEFCSLTPSRLNLNFPSIH